MIDLSDSCIIVLNFDAAEDNVFEDDDESIFILGGVTCFLSLFKGFV